MNYCADDIKYLKQILEKVIYWHKKLLPSKVFKKLKGDMLWRGQYGARTAILESLGYPIDYENAKNFSDAVPDILFDIQSEINKHHPEIRPFQFNAVKGHHTWKQKKTREWIAKQGHRSWMMTDGGVSGNKQLSLKLDAFIRYYDFKHSYPLNNLGAQFVRYLKTRQTFCHWIPLP